MDLPQYNGNKEHNGINLVNTLITSDIGWIFREQPTKDYGIDAHIEIVENGLVTGKLIAVQVKTGKSYLRRKSKNGYIYRGSIKHYNYWNNHSLPVILVLCDDEEEKCFWVQVTVEKSSVSEDYWEITVPFTQQMGISAKIKLEIIAENQTEYESRLHSLVLARPWMDELKGGNTLILEAEEWVNKTSGRGSITLKVLDPNTDEETIVLDYPIIFLGLRSYENAFKTLFPWADISVDEYFYEDYDDDDYLLENGYWDSEDGQYYDVGDRKEWNRNLPLIRPYEIVSSEVARYRLVLNLNKIGESFLLLDDFLKSGLVKEDNVQSRTDRFLSDEVEETDDYYEEYEWEEVESEDFEEHEWEEEGTGDYDKHEYDEAN